MIRRIISLVALTVLAVTAFSTAASAATWSSSAQYGSWTDGAYSLNNDVWGSGAGPQTIWANSGQNWGVWSEQPNTSGIKSYPHSTYNVNEAVNSLSSLSSYFDVSVPGSGAQFETAYDIWDSNGDELMLWMNNYGNGPIASSYNCNGACASYTNQYIGGYTWNVYSGYTDHQVWSFVNVGQSYSGTVDILAVWHWLQSHGWTGNPTVTQVQFGWEITASPSGENWQVNNWDTAFSTGSSNSNGYNYLKNRATGMFIDGLGDTSNGSDAYQWNYSGSNNQQWSLQWEGSYVRFQNRATGLYLDGMGRTSNGSTMGQWGNSNSGNQQWGEDNFGGGYYGFYNQATGLMIDGMGYNYNGATLNQWGYSGSYNQMWTIQ